MLVIKCDLCKKNVKGNGVTVSIGFSPRFELCEKCSAPIMKFLKGKKLLKQEKK